MVVESFNFLCNCLFCIFFVIIIMTGEPHIPHQKKEIALRASVISIIT